LPIFERLGKSKSPADLPVDSDNQRADDRAGSGLHGSAVFRALQWYQHFLGTSAHAVGLERLNEERGGRRGYASGVVVDQPPSNPASASVP